MEEVKIIDPNLVMKLILVALIKNISNKNDIFKIMLDYKWEVFESKENPHDYHIIGCHPVAKRLDYFLRKQVIH